MITNANLVHQPGPPSSFSYEEIEIPEPGPGEVQLKHRMIGVNFIDTYFRSGLYPYPLEPPIIPGAEATAEVVQLGPEVNDLNVGDRVVYTGGFGAYCQHRNMKSDRLVKLPEELSDEKAAACMLKGLTAHYLLHGTFQVKPGHTILFHAGAGGVGLIAGQWANHIGATVIGTVGSKEKAALARENGYHHVINYREENFVERVMEITEGAGVDVVYDSVGQDTYPYSLKCLKRLGMWVPFGQSSGPIKNFELKDLAAHGSLFTTRPSLFDYVATKAALQQASKELFEMLEGGHLKITINQKYPLKDAGLVHELLENRKTKGSTLLVP
ncbi:MAG: quinone oxidoreductase [Cyclobacteriaceae bacterium]|nr:MAG: quinone oxidoreductase [Cyclobacteriaceae bacterium]